MAEHNKAEDIKELYDDISVADILAKKLKRHIKKLDGLDNGNLYDVVMMGVEKSLLELVLKETEWNQSKASDILGINRNTLRKKIKELDIEDEE